MKRLAFLILLLHSLTVYSQNLLQRSMDRESVTRIAKAADGVMLLGTDDGLMEYDGQQVTRLVTVDCRRPYNFVNEIAALHDGTVLVGMRNGLYVADRKNALCRRIYPELAEVTSIIAGHGDSVYIGCKDGLAIMPSTLTGRVRVVPVDKTNVSSPNNSIACLAIDGGHALWVASGEGRLFSYNTKTGRLKHHRIDESLLSSAVTSMAVMGRYIYMATLNNGLLRFNKATGATERIADVWPSVKEVRRCGNALYICTDGDGAQMLRDGVLTRLATMHNSVYSCYHDASLDIDWFGYYQNGMSRVNAAASIFDTYSYGAFDSRGIFVRSFCKRGREMVIGTLDGIYYIDEAKGTVRHFDRRQMGCAIITDIKHFAGQFIVASYEHGLLAFDPASMKMTPLFAGTRWAETSCSRLVASPDSSCLYVGSSAGILCLGRHLELAGLYDSRHSDILGNYVYDMALDKSGKLWVSTAKGMRILNTHTHRFQNTGYPQGFWNTVPNLTFSFTKDGNVLAASETSLLYSKADLSSTAEHAIMQRLGIGQIDFILQRGDGYMAGTDRGLFLFDSHFRSFSQYGEADGLPSSRFTRYAPAIDEEGNIWMATNAGLVCLGQRGMLDMGRRIRAKVHVSHYAIEHENHAVEIASVNDGTISMWWNFGTGRLSIAPGILDYAQCSSRRYYLWSIDGKADSIAFDQQDILLDNLTLGSHMLRIQLAGHPETAATLTVSVQPSAMFFVEMFVILLLLVIAFMLMRMNKRRHERARLVRQKHDMEIQLASANAVNKHKLQEKERLEMEAFLKKQEKENMLRNRADDYKQICAKVEKLMLNDKPYLRDNMRLSELASSVGTNATTLSQMFNDYLHTSYFDYINRYRVEEFKRKALDPECSQLTLLAVSEMCGFKRSSFFNVFKKFEGCTPSEWVKAHKEE